MSAREQGEREARLSWARARYEWRIESGLPSSMRSVPEEEAFSPAKRARMRAGFVRAGVSAGLSASALAVSGRRSLRLYDRLATLGAPPAMRGRWRRDQVFAQQRLTGTNPVVIRRCERVPERLGLDARRLGALLPAGARLGAELEEGRIFVCDYAVLDGLSCVEGRYLAAPIALFHQAPGQGLLPLAIQLGQDPSRFPVYTPGGDAMDWLMARTYLQSADGHHHQFVSHLLRSHYEPEAFVIAARRQLHPHHPVAELLAPHFRWLFAINAVARGQAASERGSFGRMKSTGMVGGEELMRRAHAQPWAERTFLPSLEARGVADPESLPGYWFRDDALAHHGALTRYVRGVLQRCYPDAASLRGDGELQAWAAELVDRQRGRVVGLPGGGVLETRAQLETICVELIFRMSAWHTATSHGQYDQYAHVINMPNGMHRPPPDGPGRVDEAWLIAAIPRRCVIDQVAATYAAGTAPLHTMLEPEPSQWRGAPALMALRAELQREMATLSATIRARNRGLERGYEALDPGKVCEGVTL